MRKITLFFVLALALVLAAPGLIGQLARARHEALVGALAGNLEGARLGDSLYEPGWFTSRATHRIAFDGPVYRRLERDLTGAAAAGDEPPELVIDSRLAHGPWPGGGGPAFMAIRSELSLLGADGGSVAIPGDVRTRVGFDGDGESRFVSPGLAPGPGFGGGVARWEGADVTVTFADGARALASAGTFGRLVLTGDAGELVLGAVTLQGRSRRSEFGFWTGTSGLRVERLEVITPDGGVVAARDLDLTGAIGEAEALVDFRFRLEAAAVTGGALADARITARLSGERIDAAEWGRYLSLRRSGGRGEAVDFARLARAGPRLGLDELAIDAPDGTLSAAAELLLPADSRPRGPLTALWSATGRAALTVSPALLAQLAQSGYRLRQTADILLATGALRERDGQYAGELLLRDGSLTVNGEPLNLSR